MAKTRAVSGVDNCDVAETECCNNQCNGAVAKATGKHCTSQRTGTEIAPSQGETQHNVDSCDVVSRIGGGGFG